MDIKAIVDSYEVDYEHIKQMLGHDSCKKVRAILEILEIGSPNIAHSKMLLRVCEDMVEKGSVTFGVSTDA